MKMKKKFIVACGGTGGHAFPGLAVAHELKFRGHDVTVWDSGRAVESSVMKSWDGPVFSTGAKQLSPKNAFAILFSILRCRKEIRRVQPDALLAMGSYSSLPPVLAAAGGNVPVILHEANTVPGRAVDYLARLANVIAISFEESAAYLSGRETVLTGLPVRKEIAGQPKLKGIPEGAFVVFVTGGSQGAHRVNEIASQALSIVKTELERSMPGRKLFVIHQTGAADEAMVMRRYASEQIHSRVQAFEYEMGSAFASADLVIARAGASTCFELACAGKPTFFIPLPSAMRNHQHYNAQSFVKAGAADEGIQESLSPRALANYILRKIRHPEELAKASDAIKTLASPDAAAKVADLVEQRAL